LQARTEPHKKKRFELQEIVIEENGKRFALRSPCLGTCSSVFRAVGVAIPPTIRVLP
jgi:hypothetical protein